MFTMATGSDNFAADSFVTSSNFAAPYFDNLSSNTHLTSSLPPPPMTSLPDVGATLFQTSSDDVTSSSTNFSATYFNAVSSHNDGSSSRAFTEVASSSSFQPDFGQNNFSSSSMSFDQHASSTNSINQNVGQFSSLGQKTGEHPDSFVELTSDRPSADLHVGQILSSRVDEKVVDETVELKKQVDELLRDKEDLKQQLLVQAASVKQYDIYCQSLVRYF